MMNTNPEYAALY